MFILPWMTSAALPATSTLLFPKSRILTSPPRLEHWRAEKYKVKINIIANGPLKIKIKVANIPHKKNLLSLLFVWIIKTDETMAPFAS